MEAAAVSGRRTRGRGGDELLAAEHAARAALMADFLDWRTHSRVFERAEAYASNLVILPFEDARESEMVPSANVSGGFFRALRATPAMGRLIEEQDANRAPVSPCSAMVCGRADLGEIHASSGGAAVESRLHHHRSGAAGFAYPPDAERGPISRIRCPPGAVRSLLWDRQAASRATLDQARAEIARSV